MLDFLNDHLLAQLIILLEMIRAEKWPKTQLQHQKDWKILLNVVNSHLLCSLIQLRYKQVNLLYLLLLNTIDIQGHIMILKITLRQKMEKQQKIYLHFHQPVQSVKKYRVCVFNLVEIFREFSLDLLPNSVLLGLNETVQQDAYGKAYIIISDIFTKAHLRASFCHPQDTFYMSNCYVKPPRLMMIITQEIG